MTKPVCVVHMNDAKLYADALGRHGLADAFELHPLKADEAIPQDVASRADVLVAHAPGAYLQQMPKLKWVQANTAGIDPWLKHPAFRADVRLSCARGSHRIPMPENILGALFHITKPYMQIALDQRESRWTRRVSETLAGKTLGILGLGAIGREVARKASALEMRVIGTKRTAAPLLHVEKVYSQDETDEVLRQSDFVLLLLPVTPETENSINAARLRAMKPTAWLLNFARGALVVDEDLIAAVKSKTIAGAILDVFRQEPLPTSHPFWKTEGILVLPHLGGGWAPRGAAVAEIFAENARQFLKGEPLGTEVARDRGY